MEPKINNLSTEDNRLSFTLSNIELSIVNAFRRTLLSDIPIVVFRTFPYEDNLANIEINTSRLNNEIIKQRLSCVPIYINDLQFPVNDYQIEIDIKNNSEEIIYVTTKDIKVKNKTNEKYVLEADKLKMFPPDSITGDFIDLVRLRPKITTDGEGEHLKLTCGFSVGTSGENSMFNVVTTCSFGNTPDKIKLNDLWSEREKELKETDPKILKTLKLDFDIIEGQRNYIKNSYDFVMETNNIYNNNELITISASIINKKLDSILASLVGDKNIISPVTDTMPNCFEILLENQDYTIGKLIENKLYKLYFENGKDKALNYVSFIKYHPHDDHSFIKLSMINIDDPRVISKYIITACEDIKKNVVMVSKLITS
tara:strand:+ start:1852 stop:2961 length:1110 start_codon:yes stop_codon:yes gene_type:complete